MNFQSLSKTTFIVAVFALGGCGEAYLTAETPNEKAKNAQSAESQPSETVSTVDEAKVDGTEAAAAEVSHLAGECATKANGNGDPGSPYLENEFEAQELLKTIGQQAGSVEGLGDPTASASEPADLKLDPTQPAKEPLTDGSLEHLCDPTVSASDWTDETHALCQSSIPVLPLEPNCEDGQKSSGADVVDESEAAKKIEDLDREDDTSPDQSI